MTISGKLFSILFLRYRTECLPVKPRTPDLPLMTNICQRFGTHFHTLSFPSFRSCPKGPKGVGAANSSGLNCSFSLKSPRRLDFAPVLRGGAEAQSPPYRGSLSTRNVSIAPARCPGGRLKTGAAPTELRRPEGRSGLKGLAIMPVRTTHKNTPVRCGHRRGCLKTSLRTDQNLSRLVNSRSASQLSGRLTNWMMCSRTK